MKISELLDGIRKRDIVLPEFQREYVWSRDQAKQLMVSLVRDYPVGGLLFWKTDRPPELKNINELPERLGNIQVILDGQQRLTTLSMLVTGEIPPYYIEPDIKTDPRNLYYNMSNGDFQYYQRTRMQDNPLWLKTVDCFQPDNPINVFEVAKAQDVSDQEAFELAQIYNNNLNKLHNVKNVDLPIQFVPPHATLTDAIDIFDRVNSRGTKLTDADLALTHITGKWAQARRVMKAKIEELSNANFYFDLTFMTRSLTSVVTNHAIFENIHNQPREQLEVGWERLSNILDYLVTILPQRAYVHSTYDLNTTNVLVPIIFYLSRNSNQFPNETAIKHAIHWLYAAHTWARYTSQTDQRLEFDLSVIVREPNPWKELCNQIIDQRGRIEVKSSDLEGRGIRHPLYKMTLILAKAHGAVDWFNGVPLGGKPFGKSYQIHNHHIFPSSQLYQNGFDPDNHLHKKIVNEIANRAVLTGETNLDISNKLPEEYFPLVEEKYPGALVKQFIPMNPVQWKIENYNHFLEDRRRCIARKINEFMAALVTEPEPVHHLPIMDLIALGESATLELKSTLRWDVVQSKANKALQKSSLKTIVAFLNSQGGTLVIGVEDDGNIYGLENDLRMTRNSTDRFGNLLATLITDYIGAEFAKLIDIRFEQLDGHWICVVDVENAPIPAYLQGDRGTEFYTRLGPTSRMLDLEETVNYINMNFN